MTMKWMIYILKLTFPILASNLFENILYGWTISASIRQANAKLMPTLVGKLIKQNMMQVAHNNNKVLLLIVFLLSFSNQ